MMIVHYYANQFKSWQGAEISHGDYAAAWAENQEGLRKHNEHASDCNLANRELRYGDSGLLDLLGSMLEGTDFIGCMLDVPKRFPGVVSFDLESKTFGAYLTKDDYIRNRVQSIKVGRYLRRTGMYSDDVVNNIANKIISTARLWGEVELKFAETGDEIVEVYTNGPSSCMAYYFDDLDCHPVYVYGTDDVSCAYVEVDGRIVARTLVNRLENTYSVVYGNDCLIEPLLEKANFESGGNLDGCRILAIRTDNDYSWIVPYVDRSYYAEHAGGGYLVIGSGNITLESDCGVSESGPTCAECGCGMASDDYIELSEYTYVCSESCAESQGYVMANARHGYVYRLECDAYYCETDASWYESSTLLVEVDDKYYLHGDDDIVESDEDGEFYLREDCTYLEHIDSWVLDDEVDNYPEEEEDECIAI